MRHANYECTDPPLEVTFAVAGGGLAFVDRQHPTSVYLAYPGIDVQVEVFDPSAGQARRLVTSGQIAPLR